MEKSRDGERGEKRGREGVIPQRLDLASAVDALYANMFGAAGGPSAYSAAAAAAAMGLGNLPPGLPPGYPPVSSSAGLASLAAAQQAQQAQAAALASLNPSAGKGFYTWWNLAGLQQMELLSRLQGGLGGYPGLHPEHLMNLEILQAQHAAAMAAALSASNKSSSSSAASRTSSNGSTSSTGSATLHSKSASRSGGAGGASGSVSGGSGSRSGHSHSSSSRDSRGGVRGSELSRSSFGASENNRLSQQRSSSSASSHHRWARNGSDSGISVRSDLGSASGSLSYGIASLMADKMPSHKTSHRSTPSSTSSSEVIRSKELEIIPISSSMAPGGGLSKDPTKGLFHPTERGLHHSSKASAEREALGLGGRGGGGLFSQAEITPKVSLSSLTNGIPGTLPTPPPSVWKEDSANVSIEPCSRGTPPEDAPLNLSLKAGSHKGEKSGTSASSDPEKRHHSKESSSSDLLMNKLKPPLNPFDYSQGLGLGMGLMPHEMAPSLEVLQSLYGHHGEPRDVLASMQEALQRQLLVADSKKRDEKKRRSRNNSSVEITPVSSSGTPLLGGNGLHPQEGGERKRPSSTVASSTTTTTATITATAISNDGRPSSAGSSVSPSLGGVLGKNPLSGLLSFPYELPEMMSDSDSDDSTSISSVDEDSGALPFPSPWLKMDSADRLHSGSPPTKKRKMITDERSLRVPLMYGWRRETTMRGITQSGVRGEVIYFAPCGKAFKQYPDIIRYLERQNIAEVTRDNFSFSSKITVGEYVDANTQQRYSEKEIRDIVREFRVKKGLRVHQQQLAKKQEAWKEQEKLKKQEELRKEKEEQRKAREELNRQRLYEQLKKAQEREQEKQKQKLIKEQERERRRYHGILVRTLEARKRYEEREKRRGVLREEKRVFKERKKEERQAARELTILLKEAKEDMELTDHHQLPDVPQVACMRLPPEAFGNVLMIFEFLHNFGETLGFDMESLPSLQSLQLAFLGDGESEEELLSVLTHLLVCAIEDPGIPNSQRNTTILGQTLNRADITHANISEILRIYLFANATGEVRTIYGLHGTEKERRETPAKGQEWDERMNENEAYKMSLWLQKVPFLALNPTQKTEVVGYVCHELLQNKAVVKQIEDSLDRHNGLKTEKWKLDARIRKLRMSVARRRLYTTALRNVADANREDSNLSTVSSVCSSPWEGEKGVDRKGEDAKAKDVVEEEDDDEHELDDNDNESANESDAPEEAHAAPDEDEDKNLNMDEANKTLEQLQKQMDQVRQELFETSQQVRGYNAGQDRYQRTLWVLPHAGGPFMEGINTCDYVGRSHFPLDIPTPGPKEGLTLEEAKESLCHHQKHDSPEEGEEKAAVKEELDRKENVKVEQMVEVGLMSPKSEPVKMEVKEERLVNGEPEDHKDLKVKEEREVNHSGVSEGTQQHELGAPKHPLSSNVHLTEGTSSSSKHPTEESECTKGIEPSPTSASSKTSGESPPGQAASKPTDAVLQQPKDPHVCDSVDKDLVATGLGLIPGQYLRPEHVAQCEKLAFSLLPRTPCYPRSLACVPHNSSPLGTPKRGSESPLLHPNSPFVSSNGSTPLSSLTPILQNSLVSNSMSHQELLDKLHQTAEALPIPPEYKTGWWHFNDSNMLQEMTVALNERGARERELKRFLERNINIVKNTLTKVDPDVATFDPLSDDEVIVYDSLGFPARDEAEHWRLDVALKVDLMALEAVYALEEKITNASMQNKNWRLGEVGERSQFEFSPACDPTQDKKNPIHLGRDLLLALEEGIERRYLKPPLGILPAPKSENGVEPKTGLETPKGLGTWREAVFKCETAAQLAMCTYMLETAVAWDKSIMKAYCQFCHSGDFEEKLLLCDGCDRGYHTHCFKPPMDNIPEGDWYCYECVNKFSESSQRHCLVCGGMEGRTLVHCASCPRAYHTTCINPPLTKVPRNKWNCPACSSKSPRGRRGRTKKTPDGGNTPTSVTPSKTPAAAEPTTPTLNQNSGPPPSTNCTSPPKSLVMDPGDTPGEIPLAQNPPAAPPPPPALSPPPPNNVIVVSPSSIPCSFTAVSSPTPVITTTTNTTPNGTTLPSTTPLTAPMTVPSPANHAPKKERGIKKKDLRELMVCKVIQKEMMAHEDAWPFLLPVNTRQFPTYKKIIKKPIDLSTINKRLEDTFYKSKEDYSDDLHLMFNNCETFNEDDSPVGKAGHSLRSFFEAKWNENFLPT